MIEDVLFWLVVLAFAGLLLCWIVRTHDQIKLPKDFKLMTQAEVLSEAGRKHIWLWFLSWFIPPGD
jgi:hypothetical protein